MIGSDARRLQVLGLLRTALLILVFGAVLLVLDVILTGPIMDVVIFSSIRPVRLSGLMLSAALSPFVQAALLSFPLSRSFPRAIVACSLLVTLPTISNLTEHLVHSSGRPFVVAAWLLSIISTAFFVPYFALRLQQRQNRT